MFTPFGFGISDILRGVQLVCRSYAHLAPVRDDYKSVSMEVESLKTILRAVNEQLELSSSGRPLDENGRLEQTVSKCNTMLEQIGDLLKRHEHIDSQSVIHPKVRLKDHLGDIERLRRDVASCCALLNPRFPHVLGDDSIALSRMGRHRTGQLLASKLSITKELRDEKLCDGPIKIVPPQDHSQDSYTHPELENAILDMRSVSGPKSLCYEIPAFAWSHKRPQHSALVHSTLERLSRGMGNIISIHTSKLLTIVSPILFASSANAVEPHCGSHEDQVYTQARVHDHVSWVQALYGIQRDLLFLWTRTDARTIMHNNNDDPKPEPATSTLLIACFLCTSAVALVAQAGRNDPYQPYVVCFSAMISAIGGALFAVDAQDFIFRYLFWGCLGGVGISLLFHRLMAVTARKPEGSFEKDQASTLRT